MYRYSIAYILFCVLDSCQENFTPKSQNNSTARLEYDSGFIKKLFKKKKPENKDLKNKIENFKMKLSLLKDKLSDKKSIKRKKNSKEDLEENQIKKLEEIKKKLKKIKISSDEQKIKKTGEILKKIKEKLDDESSKILEHWYYSNNFNLVFKGYNGIVKKLDNSDIEEIDLSENSKEDNDQKE